MGCGSGVVPSHIAPQRRSTSGATGLPPFGFALKLCTSKGPLTASRGTLSAVVRARTTYHPTTFAVRTDRNKYICYNGVWDISELFDLQADPYEMNNLIGDTAYRGIGLQLKDEPFRWLAETGGCRSR